MLPKLIFETIVIIKVPSHKETSVLKGNCTKNSKVLKMRDEGKRKAFEEGVEAIVNVQRANKSSVHGKVGNMLV